MNASLTPGGRSVLEAFDSDATTGEILDGVTRFLRGGNLWYRGEATLYPTAALPVLARESGVDLSRIEPDFVHGSVTFPIRVLTKGEEEVLRTIQAARPDDPYFYKLVQSDFDPAWLALARHHGYPTRLLDVTRDLCVALFFACYEHPDNDGFILAYEGLWNPESNRGAPANNYRDLFDAALGDSIPTYREADRTQPGTLSAHSDMLAASLRSRFKIAYLFECVAALNERMNAQKGAFIWRGDPTKSLLDDIP